MILSLFSKVERNTFHISINLVTKFNTIDLLVGVGVGARVL